MKCFVLASSPTVTGRSAVVVELARRLAIAHADVHVFSDTRRTGDLRGWLKTYGLPDRRELVLSTVARPDQYLADALRLARLLKRERPDAILCTESNDRILARWACRLSATRPVVAAFGPTPEALRHTSPDLALLPVTMDHLYKKPAVAVGPLVDTQRFTPPSTGQKQAAREKLGLPADARVAGWVGRIKAGRGAFCLLDAFARTATTHPRLHLFVIGFGERLPLLQWRAQQMGLSARVHFAGFRRADLPSCYHAMDALCLTAIGNDGLGRAGLEAAASNVPSWVVAQTPWTTWADDGAGCALVTSQKTGDGGWAGALSQIATADDAMTPGSSVREWVTVRQLDGARLIAALLAPQANMAEPMW